MKVQLRGTIGQGEKKQTITGLGIYIQQDKTISFKEEGTHYFLNLEQMTFRKENEETILFLRWDLTQSTMGSYQLKSMRRTFDLPLKTTKMEVSSSHFLVEYQLEEEIISFELAWEEVA